jgi:hypothetical protein
MCATTSAPFHCIYLGSADLLDGLLSFVARSPVHVELRAFKVGHLGTLFCVQFNNRLDEYDDTRSIAQLKQLSIAYS